MHVPIQQDISKLIYSDDRKIKCSNMHTDSVAVLPLEVAVTRSNKCKGIKIHMFSISVILKDSFYKKVLSQLKTELKKCNCST